MAMFLQGENKYWKDALLFLSVQYVLADKNKQSTSASTATTHPVMRLGACPPGHGEDVSYTGCFPPQRCTRAMCHFFCLSLLLIFPLREKNTNNNSVCLIGPSRLIVFYYYPGMPSRVLGTIFSNFVVFKAIGKNKNNNQPVHDEAFC